MKEKIIFLLISIFLLTNCATSKKSSLDTSKSKEKIKETKEIKIGMDKKEVEEICGKDYKIYKSETGMMEIWFYDNFYVGFDKKGKVIKFDVYEKKVEKEK